MRLLLVVEMSLLWWHAGSVEERGVGQMLFSEWPVEGLVSRRPF